MIADLGLTPRYAGRPRELEMHEVRQRKLGWRVWYGPGMGANLVTATKPDAT
jgi:arsenite methyltransferase